MMMSGAVGGKTARSCENCLQRRARWYCAADDAFLCQLCDVSVHSANPLFRRHERVRLETASCTSSVINFGIQKAPAWMQGLKRKARSPRKKPHVMIENGKESEKKMESLVVPDLEALLDDVDNADEEELMYRVPIVEAALLAELRSPTVNVSDDFLDVPQEQFAADDDAEVEALLGRGLDDEEDQFCLDVQLELNDNTAQHIKVEHESTDMGASSVCGVEVLACELGLEIGDHDRDHIHLHFDDDEKIKTLDQEQKPEIRMNFGSRCSILKLDYEAVISAWSSKQFSISPWTDGRRPVLLDPDQIFANCFSATWGVVDFQGAFSSRMNAGQMQIDGGREARVTRYREKRQMRLFSKKIRYEVRKLNAEKRPRMKGRFVKRLPGTSFPVASTTFPY